MKVYKLILLFILLFVVIFGRDLFYEKAIRVDLKKRFISPSLETLFGTDELGRDYFSRVIVGLSNTLRIGIISLLFSSLLGILVGIISGMVKSRFIKYLSENIFNIIWAVPGIPFFVAIFSYFPKSIFTISLAIALFSWVPVARMTRFLIESEKEKLYTLTLKAFGFSNFKITMEIFHNIKMPVFISILSISLDLIVAESTLSFLGLGIQPPEPSLGHMINTSLNYIAQAPWLFLFPNLFLILIISGLLKLINKLGKNTHTI